MIKKLANGVLVAVIACSSLSALSACGLEEVGSALDETKTTLEIANQDKGLGDEWLQAVAREFENAYADWEGKDGKVGVQVSITNQQDELNTSSLMANMPKNGFDVYVVASSSYTTLHAQQYNGKSILADITDVVTDLNYDTKGNTVADGTGSTSIASRMVTEYSDYYNLGTKEQPSYYGLPFYATPGGGIYDADCFNEYALYYKADGTIGARQADIDAGNCGKGPDGKLGTYDDGMPATWEEFKALMQTMVLRGVTPWIWGGGNSYQREIFARSLYANYAGANDYRLLYTLNGTHSKYGAITPENGYLLGAQEGKLGAIKAVADIMSDPNYYSPDAMNGSTSHTNAQMYYVKSIDGTSNGGKRIAMFMEGGWWENEAREHFDDMSSTPGWGFGERNFKILPVPSFVGTTLATAAETGGEAIVSVQQDNRQVMICNDGGGSAIFVSAQAPQLELAKEFIKFAHSRKMLVLMTQVSACLRPFEYEFETNEFLECTKFTQSVITMKTDENTDIVWTAYPRNGLVERVGQTYFDQKWYCAQPFNDFYQTKASVYQVYKGQANFNAANWPR